MGSELIVLYIPIALLALGFLLFLCYRPSSRWIGATLLLVSIVAGAWASMSGDSTLAQSAFFSTGFLAGCIFTAPFAYLIRWLVRRFSGAATS